MAFLARIKLNVQAIASAMRMSISRAISEIGTYRPVRIAFGPNRTVRVHPRYVEILGGFQDLPEANFDREHFSQFIAELRVLIEGHRSHATLAHQNGLFTIEARIAAEGTVATEIVACGSRESFRLPSEEVNLLISNYEKALTSILPTKQAGKLSESER